MTAVDSYSAWKAICVHCFQETKKKIVICVHVPQMVGPSNIIHSSLQTSFLSCNPSTSTQWILSRSLILCTLIPLSLRRNLIIPSPHYGNSLDNSAVWLSSSSSEMSLKFMELDLCVLRKTVLSKTDNIDAICSIVKPSSKWLSSTTFGMKNSGAPLPRLSLRGFLLP